MEEEVRPPRTSVCQRFRTFLRLWIDPWFLGSLVLAGGLHVVVLALALMVPERGLSVEDFETDGIQRLVHVKLLRGSKRPKLDVPEWLAPSQARTVRGQVPPPQPGLLTAASVGDVDRFDNYLSYLNRHEAEGAQLGLRMDRRVRIRVVDDKNRPVNDARVQLAGSGRIVAEGRTHADGIWDFYPDAHVRASRATKLTLEVWGGQRRTERTMRVPRSGEGPEQLVRLSGHEAKPPGALDLAFLVDVTGSMADEMAYLSREVTHIVRRIRAAVPRTRIRVGAVLYRDRFDDDRLQSHAFTRDVKAFARALSKIQARGGGDYPEDMEAGLQLALRGLRWRQGNVARVLVLIGDAPPKRYADARYRTADAMRDAARDGIRVLPVAASGADSTVEYLFRALGAFTSTPYVLLSAPSRPTGLQATDDPEAATDRVAVERFNNLLVRMVVDDLRGRGMHEPGVFGPSGQPTARRQRAPNPA
jgi:hypothetical protein